mmetsp:Transcript_95550/g.169669  ORF Transcript_95550/g.169669 Transcript_95550/m.169669 type:complete len:387 (-) Transcript_95550:181-1341(-)
MAGGSAAVASARSVISSHNESDSPKTSQSSVPPITRDNTQVRNKAASVRASFKRPAWWVLAFGWSLGLFAGFVNAVSFRRWGLFVSHVTGSTTAIGLRIEGVHDGLNEFGDIQESCLLIFSFLSGAFLCGLLIDKNTVHFMGKAFYGAALLWNSLLLILACIWDDRRLLSACLTAVAMGLQNAMCTSHFGAIIRTTHVTGTVTDIGSTLGRIAMIYLRNGCQRSSLNVLEKAEVGVDARKVLVLLPMWVFFLIGCIIGAYAENAMGKYALLIPAGFTFTVGLGYLLFRQMLKAYFTIVERDQLDADIHHVEEELARVNTFLHTMAQRGISASESSSDGSSDDAQDDRLVADLDEGVGHILETLHEVEAEMDNVMRQHRSRRSNTAH